jgi:modulator of FtsH protease
VAPAACANASSASTADPQTNEGLDTMNSLTPIPTTTTTEAGRPAPTATGRATATIAADASRVLRNTYALLSMTLLFSAAVAAASAAFQLPAPGVLLTLGGYFGLLFAVYRFKNSGWALPAVFALTGFMGYSLGPVLARSLALPGGAQVVAMALAATGATFLALSAWVLTTRRDFSFMGGFLFAGMVIALIAGLGAVFLQMPALGLAVAAMVALLSAGLILFETSRIVNGGETNYVLATVGLYVSIFNLFTSLLSLFGFGNSEE